MAKISKFAKAIQNCMDMCIALDHTKSLFCACFSCFMKSLLHAKSRVCRISQLRLYQSQVNLSKIFPSHHTNVSSTCFFAFAGDVSGNRCFTKNAVVSLSHGKSLSRGITHFRKYFMWNLTFPKITFLGTRTVTFQTFQNGKGVF